MVTNDLVEIWNITGEYRDADGLYHEGTLKRIKTKFVDVQPYSTERLLKDYGYEIDVNKRVFTNDLDNDIKIDTVIKYPDNDDYFMQVQKFLPWDNYMEIFCLDNTK